GLFWPDQAFRDMVMCMIVFGVMLYLTLFWGHGNSIPVAEEQSFYESAAYAGQQGYGVHLDAPADPSTPTYSARPEWYFLFLFELVKLFPGEMEIIGALVIPGIVFLVLFLLPPFGYGRMRAMGHFVGIVVVVALLAGVGMLTYLALEEDKANVAFQDAVPKQEALARRAVQLGKRIPEEGAKYLLR